MPRPRTATARCLPPRRRQQSRSGPLSITARGAISRDRDADFKNRFVCGLLSAACLGRAKGLNSTPAPTTTATEPQRNDRGALQPVRPYPRQMIAYLKFTVRFDSLIIPQHQRTERNRQSRFFRRSGLDRRAAPASPATAAASRFDSR
ncbi:unnamed protein product [Lampetra planeri]